MKTQSASVPVANSSNLELSESLVSPAHRTWKDELRQSLQQVRQLARQMEENSSDLPLEEVWLNVSQADRDLIAAAKDRFPFMVSQSYAQLIDWQDPQDPLRQLLLPTLDEENIEGSLDTSGESLSTVVPGLQHKYEQTAVLIVTQACAGHCRYCFRRRLMSQDVWVKETIGDLQGAIGYIQQHSEIDNVLLSGGDPMLCSTKRLANLFAALAKIPHLWQIRISSKLPAFLPSRFTTDPELLAVLQAYQDRFQIVFQCHFDHPREITSDAKEALANLRQVGCVLTAQIPLIKGVNHQVETLTQLFKQLHRLGVLPQYLFHPRPVKHATHFQLSILEGLKIVKAVRHKCNGSVKRFRYILTHSDGKLELVGHLSNQPTQLVTRWHQLRRGSNRQEIMIQTIEPNATWLD